MIREWWSFAAVLALGALGACRSEPYCLNCVGPDGETVNDASAADASVEAGADARADVTVVDTGPEIFVPDGCTPGAEELCNGVDDNCDGRVDEGFDLQTSVRNCGACGRVCAPARSIPDCAMGAVSDTPLTLPTNRDVWIREGDAALIETHPQVLTDEHG